jgi:hypothetical protein
MFPGSDAFFTLAEPIHVHAGTVRALAAFYFNLLFINFCYCERAHLKQCQIHKENVYFLSV